MPSPARRTQNTTPIDLGPLTRRVGYMLRRAYNLVHEQGRAAFEEHDLKPQQFGILLFLEHAPGSKQGEVAEAIGVERSNLVGMMKPLVRRRLVRSSRAPDDGRVRVLDLTAAGRVLLRAAKRTDRRLDESFDRRLGRGGRQRLLGYLLILADLD